MIRSRTLGVAALGVMFSGSFGQGQSSGQYREYQLGANLATVAALSGTAASAATTRRSRPSILQDLKWQRPYSVGNGAPDSALEIVFSFIDDQLFRLVIDYDRQRTEGMTDADIVEALSTIYGAPLRPAARTIVPLDQIDQDSGTRIARWGDSEYAAVLYRTSYASGFRLIVTSTRLDGRARRSDAEGARLDERDAPQRERARQKKEADDARAAREKARLANKATFVP